MKIHKILMLDGKTAATLDDWVLHHGFNHDYKPGDLIELREGMFVLNNDLILGGFGNRISPALYRFDERRDTERFPRGC